MDDDLRELENKLHILIQSQESVAGQHASNKDKLLFTLGKVKGSESGGLGYLIKHVVIETKGTQLKGILEGLKMQTEAQKIKMEEA